MSVKQFSKNVAYLRKRKGWSQMELARKLGVIHQSVGHWEVAHCFPRNLYLLENLADLLQVSIDRLVRRDIEAEDMARLAAKIDANQQKLTA